MIKTNAIRILDSLKIPYQVYQYKDTTSGEEVAKFINKDCSIVYKTLVTVANTNEHYVFMVPVNMTIDLKKAAKAVNVKEIKMIKQSLLLPLTGYVHGGCSPIAMKKKFPVIIDQNATILDTIIFSAGKIGMQIELKVDHLQTVTDAIFKDVVALRN